MEEQRTIMEYVSNCQECPFIKRPFLKCGKDRTLDFYTHDFKLPYFKFDIKLQRHPDCPLNHTIYKITAK